MLFLIFKWKKWHCIRPELLLGCWVFCAFKACTSFNGNLITNPERLFPVPELAAYLTWIMWWRRQQDTSHWLLPWSPDFLLCQFNTRRPTMADDWSPTDPTSFTWKEEEAVLLHELLQKFRKLNKGDKAKMIKDLKGNKYPGGYFEKFLEPSKLVAIQKMRVSSSLMISVIHYILCNRN